MNKYHQEILEEIKKIAQSNSRISSWFDAERYMGTSKPIINITNPQTREIVKKWVKEHQNISLSQLLEMLDSLFKGASHTERSLGGKILEYTPNFKKQIDPQTLDKWLTGAEGWGEVDSLCQSSFTAADLLDHWNEWEKLLNRFVEDKNIHKRRASLVLLVKPVRESNDQRLAEIAFANIRQLQIEKDVLITKAISWLLRDLIKNHRKRVEGYLKENEDFLPKIVIREVKKKLLTGKK